MICNLGLNMILSISVPILNAIYPMSIVLILLGLTHKLLQNNKFTYPLTIGSTALISVLYALNQANVPLGLIADLLEKLPLYKLGFSWVIIALTMIIISIVLNIFTTKNTTANN